MVFGLIVALLGYSIYKKQSPSHVIKKLFESDLAPDDIRRLNKTELIELVNNKDSQISQLQQSLDSCLNDDGYQKAIISTSSETLNMRDGPSLESNVILEIPSGSRVSILYYDDRDLFLDGAMGKWCKISYAEEEGWVWGNYLTEK